MYNKGNGRVAHTAKTELDVNVGRRGVLGGMAGLLALSAMRVQAQQAYPQRPINLVVPFTPSGPVDLAGRTVGAVLGKSLGQSIVVMNKPGAGGSIAAAELSRAQPDGYQLLLALDSIMTINPTFYQDKGFATQSLDPVGMVGELSSVLVVNSKSSIQSVSDFVEHARKTTVFSGSGGNGTAGHLYAEWLARDFNLKVEHVPYKGLAPAVQNLIAGEIDCIVALIPGVLPHIKSGSLRALGLTSTRPQVLLPDVLPLSAQGLDDFEGASWLALMAPTGVAPETLSILSTALSTALQDSETIKRLQAAGIDPVFADPKQVRERIAIEAERWETLLAQVNRKKAAMSYSGGRSPSILPRLV
jgi:tripartite-type tricarboxylate transporter receptor subunit TctC